MEFAKELEVAVAAVTRACQLCTAVQQTFVSEESMAKKDRSPVTVADYGVQAVVTTDLIRAFPDIPLVGEEDASPLRTAEGAQIKTRVCESVRKIKPELNEKHILSAIDYGTYTGGGSGRHWALDPIDGTKGFLRGDQYAIALGLIVEGAVVLGVLGCPSLPHDAAQPDGPCGCVFFAAQGGGAFQQTLDVGKPKAIHVTDIADPTRANFCESVESGHSNQSDSARIAELLGVTEPPHRIDSQCKYASIARGDSSIYLRLPTQADYEEKIWDHAAGCILVTEAGGAVTDTRGNALDFSLGRTLRANVGVVATNGHLHEKVISATRQVLNHVQA